MIAIVTSSPPKEKDEMIRYIQYGEAICGISFERVIIADNPYLGMEIERHFELWIKENLATRLPPGVEVVRLDK